MHFFRILSLQLTLHLKEAFCIREFEKDLLGRDLDLMLLIYERTQHVIKIGDYTNVILQNKFQPMWTIVISINLL